MQLEKEQKLREIDEEEEILVEKIGTNQTYLMPKSEDKFIDFSIDVTCTF